MTNYHFDIGPIEDVMPDLASRLQRAGEDAWMEYQLTTADGRTLEEEDVEFVDVCICDTCAVREILEGAWPVVEQLLDAMLRIAVKTAIEATTGHSVGEIVLTTLPQDT